MDTQKGHSKNGHSKQENCELNPGKLQFMHIEHPKMHN